MSQGTVEKSTFNKTSITPIIDYFKLAFIFWSRNNLGTWYFHCM